MKKLLLFVFLILSTLIASSQIDTIIVTPSSPLPSQDSLGYNVKVVVSQPGAGSNAEYYICPGVPFPIIDMSSNAGPIAIVIVYDDFQQLWYNTQFLFNIAPDDTLIYSVGFEYACMSPHVCGFDPTDDPDYDGIVSDSISASGQIIPLIANYHSIQCQGGITEAFRSDLKIYPNFASDLVKISSPFSTGSARVYSNTGSLVMVHNFFTSNFHLNINSLDIGFYMVELIDSNGHKIAGRFIKE